MNVSICRRCHTRAGFKPTEPELGSPQHTGAGGGWGCRGTPVAAQKIVQIHVSFKYLALKISPGTTLIQFTVSGSSEV